MPKTGKFYHECQNLTNVAGVNQTFDAARRHDFNLHDVSLGSTNKAVGSAFFGRLEGCVVVVDTIAGGATKLTVKVCHQADGSQVIIPDTEATIGLNVGSTTAGSIAIKFDFPYLHSDDQIHFFYTCDAGSCRVTASELYWSE